MTPLLPSVAAYYATTAQALIDVLRQDAQWYMSFGLHSSADAINAGFTTQEVIM